MSLVAQYVEGDFPCAIVKHESLGTLCGYLGVPSCHPWYGKDNPDADVHGGITYSEHEQCGHSTTMALLKARQERYSRLKDIPSPNYVDRLIENHKKHAGEWSEYPCHTGQDVWWLGFDCSHLGDLVPGPDNPPPEQAHLFPLSGGEGWYKDETYVRAEIKGLVSQAATVMRLAIETFRE